MIKFNRPSVLLIHNNDYGSSFTTYPLSKKLASFDANDGIVSVDLI